MSEPTTPYLVFPRCQQCGEPIYSNEPYTKWRWEWMLWERDLAVHDRCKAPQPEEDGR